MAHQKYLNWAAMVTHYMRAHNQWLHIACQRVEEIYLASFCKVTRNFWGQYDQRVRGWCYHNYAQAGDRKNTLFSWAASASIQRHLETRVVRWVAISDHWLTDAWCQKEHHLATEADVVRRLLLKRKCVPSPRSMRGKRSCSYIRGDTCAIQLTMSPVRQALHHTDGVQLTGPPIRWEDVGLRDE